MEKTWNEIMARELERARTGAKMTKVPQSRRATSESLLNLEREIDSAIFDNKVMAHKSFINASKKS